MFIYFERENDRAHMKGRRSRERERERERESQAGSMPSAEPDVGLTLKETHPGAPGWFSWLSV